MRNKAHRNAEKVSNRKTGLTGRWRSAIERLEDRCTPATVTYTTATGVLQFLADAGDADLVTVTAPAPNTVQIQVGNGDAIVLAGDAIANADFVLSTTANNNDTLTIATGTSPLSTFQILLDDQGDSLNFSLANATNGVTAVSIDGQTGDDNIQLGNATTGGALSAQAETMTFTAGTTIVATTGDITLTTTDTSLTGQSIVLPTGVSLQATAGAVMLQAGDDVKLNAGSSVTAGTTISVQGDFGDQDSGTGASIELNGSLSATSLTATGGIDSDSFNVTPSATTKMSLTGSFPGSAPGDSLAFDLTGANDPFLQVTFISGDTRDGIATFSNRQSVNFDSMETLPSMDISVTAGDSPDPIQVGNTLTLTVTVTNNSAFGLNGVSVTDSFPVELTNPSWTAQFTGTGSTGNTIGNGNLNESIDLAAGGSVTYTITGTVALNATGTITNTASAAVPQGLSDSNSSNNSASSDTTIEQGSDLNVTVTDVPDPVQAAGQLTYTVTILNQGPADATGVVLDDTIPNSVTFVSATPSQGSFNRVGNVITWNAGNLANNASATLTIVVTPTSAGTISNTAAITSQHGDIDASDNSVNTDTTVTPFPSIIAVGAGPGRTPTVQVYDGATKALKFSFDAYTSAFRGGVSVATGDIDRDGVPDIITGAGPGGGPHVRVFSGVNGAPLAGVLSSFFAYDPAFLGGVSVAAGDVNNDGFIDIVTGAGPNGGPHVKVFSGANGGLLFSFYAYNPVFLGGISVAAGDVNGDGRADIITGAGPGGGPHVMAFSGQNGSVLHSFYAYTSAFAGGVTVAAGDINGDNRADIITGAGAGGGPHVRAFSGLNASEMLSFMALTPTFAGGVSVGAVDSDNNGQIDIVTGPGRNGDRQVRVFHGATATQIATINAFDATFIGGIFVSGK